MSEVKILEQTATDEADDSAQVPRTVKWLTCLIEVMILALGLVLIIMLRVGVYEPAYIPSGSMENTFQIGDRVLIDHRASLHGKWKRGDIIIFEAEGDWGKDDTLIKRVIGLPGERIELMGGQVYINGKMLAENYLKETPEAQDGLATLLAPGEYYVLGDNRNHSDDSRFNGPVKDEQIRGRAVSIFYPLGRAGRLTKPEYNQ